MCVRERERKVHDRELYMCDHLLAVLVSGSVLKLFLGQDSSSRCQALVIST